MVFLEKVCLKGFKKFYIYCLIKLIVRGNFYIVVVKVLVGKIEVGLFFSVIEFRF